MPEYPRPEPRTVYLQWNYGWGNWEQVVDEAAGQDGVVAFAPVVAPPAELFAETAKNADADWVEVVRKVLPEVHIFVSDGQYRYAAEKIVAALAPLMAGERWRPIETAPKDKLCLLFEPHDEGGFLFVGCTATDGAWVNNLDLQVQKPTHWRPLPPPPAIQSAEHLNREGE